MRKHSTLAPEITLIALSLLLLIGLMTFASPCAVHEDGSWMTCHWAGQALKGLAALLTALSALLAIFRDRGVKRGIALAMIPAALLAIALPGSLIGLCGMETMRCRMIMRPTALVVGVLVAALSAIEFVLTGNREKRA